MQGATGNNPQSTATSSSAADQTQQKVVRPISQMQGRNEEAVKARLKIREFDWFQMETKVRSFVMTLIEPTVQKMTCDRQKIDDFQEQVDSMQSKLSSLDKIFLENEQRMRLFDSATERMKMLSQEVGQLSSSRVELHATLASLKESMAEQITLQKNLRKEVNVQNETNSTKIEFSLQRVEKMREDVAYNLDMQAKRMKAFQDEIRSELSEERERRVIIERDISNIFGRLEQKDIQDAETIKHCEQLDSRSVTILIDVDNLKLKFNEFNIMKEKVDRLRADENRTNNALHSLYEYIDVYVPLNTYTMISESLFNTLPNERIKKIVEFDEKSFGVYNARVANQKVHSTFEENIVTPEKFDFNELNSIVSEKIAEIMKRNLNSKRSTTGKQGKDKKKLKHVQLNEEANQFIEDNSNHHHHMNHNGSQEGQVLNRVDGAPGGVDPNISSATIEKAALGNENTVDFGEMDEEGGRNSERMDKEEIENILKELGVMISTKVDPMKDMLSAFMEKMEKRMHAFEEESTLERDRMCEFNEIEQEKLLGLRSSLIKQVEEQDVKFEHLQKGIQLLSEATIAQEQNITMLNQFAMLVYKLMLQDEKDKQAIGLYGFQENPLDNEKLMDSALPRSAGGSGASSSVVAGRSSLSIRIDENCLQCSGKSTMTNQYFKLACLAYKPLPVEVDGKEFSRLELLQICSNMMTQLKLMLNSSSHPQPSQAASANGNNTSSLYGDKTNTALNVFDSQSLSREKQQSQQQQQSRIGTPNTIDYAFKNYQIPLLNEIVAQSYRSTSRQSRATRTPAVSPSREGNTGFFSHRSHSNPGSRQLIHEKPTSPLETNLANSQVQGGQTIQQNAQQQSQSGAAAKESQQNSYLQDQLPDIKSGQMKQFGNNSVLGGSVALATATQQQMNSLFFKPTTRKLVSKKPPSKQNGTPTTLVNHSTSSNNNNNQTYSQQQQQHQSNTTTTNTMTIGTSQHMHSNPEKFKKFLIKSQQTSYNQTNSNSMQI